MGRHRKPSAVNVRRQSVIALTGLVPAGLATVTGASDGSLADKLTASVQQRLSPESAEENLPRPEAAAAPVAAPELMREAKQAAPPPPPVVKTVALPDGRVPAAAPAGPLGMPGIAEAAYRNAERILAAENPVCGMPWSMLAGIGRVESTHAFGGKADDGGNPLSPVYGPVLDGSLYGNNVIHDSDGGELDGLTGYDRAIGPMQFLPETWHKFAADGNGDGIADPQNLFDAALTAGKYLCSGGLDMRDPAQETRAILRYNNSMAYVANVMAWEVAYRNGVAPQPAQLPRI
ncbi:lytic transglycosylase domain-containing protein [Nocardia sp. NPDC050406]|uniref:lytic transglycosylase domain-containing protein n=1 Tax=Nocardia sp. NPDC050406 TaxID=3364318 RepID=UPI00378FA6ED